MLKQGQKTRQYATIITVTSYTHTHRQIPTSYTFLIT